VGDARGGAARDRAPTSAALWSAWPPIHHAPALAVPLLPLAVCLAIVRDQLYDIDLVLSRTAARTGPAGSASARKPRAAADSQPTRARPRGRLRASRSALAAVRRRTSAWMSSAESGGYCCRGSGCAPTGELWSRSAPELTGEPFLVRKRTCAARTAQTRYMPLMARVPSATAWVTPAILAARGCTARTVLAGAAPHLPPSRHGARRPAAEPRSAGRPASWTPGVASGPGPLSEAASECRDSDASRRGERVPLSAEARSGHGPS
jgi:hypothetical protein